MSIAKMNEAWSQKNLRPADKLILMALADISDEDGLCWPKVNTIAVKCNCSKRTVQRVLNEFEALGLIKITPRSGDTSLYQVLPGDGETGSEAPTPSGLKRRETSKSNRGEKTAPTQNVSPHDGRNSCHGGGAPAVTLNKPPINHQYNNISDLFGDRPKPKRQILSFPKHLGIKPDVEAGYKNHRKAKNAPLSERAIQLLTKQLEEIQQAGIDPNDALDTAIERGWQGLKASWILNNKPNVTHPNYSRPTRYNDDPGVDKIIAKYLNGAGHA